MLLTATDQLLLNHEADICAALKADLNRHRVEAYVGEVAGPSCHVLATPCHCAASRPFAGTMLIVARAVLLLLPPSIHPFTGCIAQIRFLSEHAHFRWGNARFRRERAETPTEPWKGQSLTRNRAFREQTTYLRSCAKRKASASNSGFPSTGGSRS